MRWGRSQVSHLEHLRSNLWCLDVLVILFVGYLWRIGIYMLRNTRKAFKWIYVLNTNDLSFFIFIFLLSLINFVFNTAY